MRSEWRARLGVHGVEVEAADGELEDGEARLCLKHTHTHTRTHTPASARGLALQRTTDSCAPTYSVHDGVQSTDRQPRKVGSMAAALPTRISDGRTGRVAFRAARRAVLRTRVRSSYTVEAKAMWNAMAHANLQRARAGFAGVRGCACVQALVRACVASHARTRAA